jgi:hypothetical protein
MCSEHLQRVKDEDVLSLDELATIHLIATTSSHETFDPHATRKLLSFLEEISVMHAQDPRFTTIVLTASKKRELHQLWAAVRDSERKPPTIDGALADEAVSRWVAAAALPRVSPDAAEANDRKKPWRLVGYDTFDGEAYFLSGYDSEDACRRAASERLAELEREQPSDISGGQDGIQDWVFIVTPAGTYDRYLRTLGE